MRRHVGIVACSAPGAALCHQTIGAADPATELSMHGAPLADYVACLERGDLDGVAELMLASADRLAGLGAELLICPDNTIHAAFARMIGRSPRPWLHIAEVVAAEVAARGVRRVGVLGTRWLVDSDVYPRSYVRPDDADRDAIDRIIMSELVRGEIRSGSITAVQRVIARMAGLGCDAVVLGCTELPLLFEHAPAGLPTLDSTRLLARAAVAWSSR